MSVPTPEGSARGSGATEAPDAPALPPSIEARRWTRGGPGHPGPSAAAGPATTPEIAFEVDLGAVIFSTPRFVETKAGRLAFVGTHGGRFVGVAVDGDRLGEIVVDLPLGGRIWGSAAVDDEGVVYIGTDDDHLHAIDAATGEERWRTKLGNCSATRAPGPEGSRCDVDGGPTLGPDGDLYVGADGVYRVRRSDGEIVWHYPPAPAPGDGPGDAGSEGEGASGPKAPKEPNKPKATDAAHAEEAVERPHHVFSAPVVTATGEIYVGGQDGHVTSLDAEGKLRWKYKVIADVDGSPTMGSDGAIYVGADDGRVYALRDDGSLRWSFVAQRDIRSAVASGPEGRIYVTSFDGNLYALEASGEVAWVLGTAAPIMSSPVVDAAGNVFFGGQDEQLYAVSPAGKVLWRVELPGDVDSSVAIAPDGLLVVGCDDGHLRGYRAPE